VASDGCIVLSNPDLETLATRLQIGSTPVVIADSIDWAKPEDVETLRAGLIAAIENWRRDWASRDTDAYLRHYAREFNANGANLARWSAQKRQINSGKTWINVRVSNMSLLLYPGKEQMAVATFEQDYQSNNLSNRMMKRQYWVRENDQWRIVLEGGA
jgi:murein L,D-transpeptidase YafK